jgi:ABC-type multidrug transport system fused ATPase/permease subunit
MALDKQKPGKATNPVPDDAEVTELQVSNLDDKTHAELRMLYAESTETLRFIKNHQWKTVGATLLTYLGLIVIAVWTKAGPAMSNKLMAITILLATAVILTLVIYQFWMHNEMTKLDAMNPHLSSLFREVRALKSKREGNAHRYTLLLFMAIVVTLGAVVVHLALNRISGG